MKKILIPLVLVVIGATSRAQSEKKPPPPPPPKPKNEVVKFVPPIIIDEKLDASKTKPPVITVKGKMADEFYNRNPTVSAISRQGNILTLKMKDGTTEKYDMSKKEEDRSFTETYGVSPIPPPPPPKVDITKFQAPASAGIKSQKDFLERNPNVANLNWQSGKTKTIILSLKSGEEERYDLTNEEEKKVFFGKYGVPPLQPPPPPPPKTKSKA